MRTHCKAGHEYTAATTYVTKTGDRHCKVCRKERMRARRASDVGVGRGGRNSEKTACPQGHPYDEQNTIIRDGKRACRACAATNSRVQMLKKYGLSQEQWSNLMAAQGDVCAICQQPFPSLRQTHVDHFHDTGQVRGLLCKNCNNGVGFFNDSPRLMLAAAQYLLDSDAFRITSP